MQAYALLSDEENGRQDETMEVSFHVISKAIYLLVPTPQNTPTKLPLQKEVKSLEFTRVLQDPFKTNIYFAVEY